MGCDIHLFIEVRRNGKWEPAKMPVSEWDPSDDERYWATRNFSDRNYDLFAILANVRNGTAFGGIRTGEGFIPIAQPRGLPEDMSTELRVLETDPNEDAYDANVNKYGCGWFGEHGYSWLTLKELADFNWNQTTRHAKYQGEHDGMIPFGEQIIGWHEPTPYKECAGRFYSKFMPALAKLGEPQDVRILFGFDSQRLRLAEWNFPPGQKMDANQFRRSHETTVVTIHSQSGTKIYVYDRPHETVHRYFDLHGAKFAYHMHVTAEGNVEP